MLSPEKLPYHQSRRRSADEAGQDADGQSRGAQGGAVDDELGVEQDGTHHERRQPVVLHAALGEGGCKRDGAVHTQRRGNTQNAGRNHAQRSQATVLDGAEQAVDRLLAENRDHRAQHHAQRPVGEDLPELEFKVVPEIDELPVEYVQHEQALPFAKRFLALSGYLSLVPCPDGTIMQCQHTSRQQSGDAEDHNAP